MPVRLRPLFEPLNLAGLLTVLAVALSLRAGAREMPAALALLGLFTVLFLLHSAAGLQRRDVLALVAAQALSALAVVALAPRGDTTPVLLVVLAAQAVRRLSPMAALALCLALDVALWAVLRYAGHPAPLAVTGLFTGFQAFAALTAHYADAAMRSRDALARVNADLLATRSLLADGARDAERLRVARELHDVAGHALTALTLNLRALSDDPAIAARPELAIAQSLARGLLADLRGVVQRMRDGPGLDLVTALHALAAPIPRPQLDLRMDDGLRVDDAAVAEAVLRLVQEALTNAARHAGATRLRVSLMRDGNGIALHVEDDGQVQGTVREGSGLAGMRERIAAVGGRFDWTRASHGGMAIDAWIPA